MRLPKNNIGAAAGMILVAVLTAALLALNTALVQGQVPIPAEWHWIVPILSAGLVALVAGLTPYLRRR